MLGTEFVTWTVAMVVLGLGTAMVYPTLLAAITDVAHPDWRPSAVGVYRLWRDAGYAVGALTAGILADIAGVPFAVGAVAALTFASGYAGWLVRWKVRPHPVEACSARGNGRSQP